MKRGLFTSGPPTTAMDTKPRVAAIAGDAEVGQAIATLIFAFSTDPVARWIYDDPHQYLRHIPLLFRALGKSSFESGAAQRTSDGLGAALWLPPGVHGDDGALEASLKKASLGKVLRGERCFRADGALPADGSPLVLIAHRGRSVAPEQRVWCHTTAARA